MSKQKPIDRRFGRIKVDAVAENRLDVTGPIGSVIGELKDHRGRLERDGWTNIRIVENGEYEDQWLDIVGLRDENDDELRKRIGKLKRQRTLGRRR